MNDAFNIDDLAALSALGVLTDDERVIASGSAALEQHESAYREALVQLAESLPQLKSVWIFDAQGNALVNSLVMPAPSIDFSDRDYFKAHIAKDIGTFIGQALSPRPRTSTEMTW